MHGQVAAPGLLSDEEKMGLLVEERSASSSDVESESSGHDADSPLTGATSSRLRSQLSNAKWPSSVVDTSIRFLDSTPWRTLALRFVIFFVPSFLQGRHAREQIRPAKIAPTAYLDGMRGLAALFVYLCHYSYQAFEIAASYGASGSNYDILKLPFIRIIYGGPAAVCVFFVISGYALSYKPLKLIRAQSTAEFSTTMSSMMFRRGIRLFLPTAISTLMVALFLQMGVFELTRDFANDRTYHKNIMEPHAVPMESMYAQLINWFWTMVGFMHVFTWDKYAAKPSYDVHLWTIPVEFRCSMYLFLVFLGTARLQTRMRFVVVGFVSFITYRHSRWDLLLFLAGMVLAELDHIRGAHVVAPALPIDEKQPSSPSFRRVKSLFWTGVCLLGLYLLCFPDDYGWETPGWVYLTSQVPEWWGEEHFRYWQSAGAVIFILGVNYSPTWQRLFNTGVVQYFGKISYAFYLMHGPIMHSVGYHWEKWAYSITGVEGYWYNAGWILGASFAIPTVIWWADVFWRAVDIPVVKFGRWYENKCVGKSR